MVAHTSVSACVRTDGSSNEWQSILLKDDPEGFFRSAFFHSLEISRDVLVDRASAAAWSCEAVEHRQRFPVLAVRQRFDLLAVACSL